MSKRTYILDPGHGGINPSTGLYVTAGKRSPIWSDGSIYYEGVGNRAIAKLVGDQLEKLGIQYVYTVKPSDFQDKYLHARAAVANAVKGKAVYISIHSNAAPESAHGFEVFTSPGQTASDALATIMYSEMVKAFPELTGRPAFGDGDADKEELFTVLTATNCPAFLLESMFHTNEKECKILMSLAGKQRVANAIVSTIKKIEAL